MGGINISDKDLQREDTMLEIREQSVVSSVASVFKHSTNEQVPVIINNSNNTQVFFDNGISKESEILRKASEIMSGANKSIIICTQFSPDSFLINESKKAEARGIEVMIVVSSPTHITETSAKFFDLTERIRAKFKGVTLNNYPNWLHTKLIAVDLDTPDAVILYGTHNFSLKGSKWHNQELSLLSVDPQLIDIFRDYVERIRALLK